ncbi:hypothetical protein DF147_31985 [Burkholderia cenocepacia]|nr:hypothetical protein DF147_31985 [Burkholderia cenocepacia]RQV82268.1 hypothetical protein DF019_32575 [Burkholderia cenocepacia]
MKISWLLCGVSTSSLGLLMMVMSFDAEKDETRLADESAKRPMRGAGNRPASFNTRMRDRTS